MKIKEGYILREVAGNFVVLPIGQATLDFNGMISLNSTGAFLFDMLKEDVTEKEILDKMLETYEIDEETAKKDIADFIEKIKGAGIIA